MLLIGPIDSDPQDDVLDGRWALGNALLFRDTSASVQAGRLASPEPAS
jgi:hypothetical protein